MIVRMLAASLIVCSLAGPALAGDPAKGKQDFVVCQTCHTIIKGGGNGLGPNLFGVVGRKAASLPGFYYSVALKNSKITWTSDKLKAWITNPQKLVPGNRMTFPGVSDPAKADDIVAYLTSLR